MNQFNDFEQLAAELSGTPKEMAQRVADFLDGDWTELGAAAPVSDRRRRRIELDARRTELFALRHRLAQDFGRARGWILTRKWFSAEVLAAGKVHSGGRHYGESFAFPMTDHSYFYRTANRRAAAVVGHPYHGDDPRTRDEALEWAEAAGLRVSFPLDFPSWWNPGRTTLVVFERAPPKAGGFAAMQMAEVW